MLGSYSGPSFSNKQVMTVQRTKTVTMQTQPKQIVECKDPMSDRIRTCNWINKIIRKFLCSYLISSLCYMFRTRPTIE